MTEEEKAAKIAEAVEIHKDSIKARKAQEIKDGFLNPFGHETSYPEFLKEIAKSKVSIAEYCKKAIAEKDITEEQLKWLEKDIELFKSKNKEA